MQHRKIAPLEISHNLTPFVVMLLREVLRKVGHKAIASALVDLPLNVVQIMGQISRH